MAKLYYVGSQPTMRFYARDKFGAKNPSKAFVSIFTESDEVIHMADVQIVDNEVSFALPFDIMQTPEDYVAVFDMNFPPGKKERHTIRFTVVPRKLTKKMQQTSVAMIDSETSDEAIDVAIRDTLRKFRRKGMSAEEASKMIYETAHSRLGKRIDKM